ncbi:MAG TPA: aldo/keto reductase [Microbacteriaceae bacterium]|nr:aldo/keto reductase [Microbacteriaceae bacterium]
MLSRQLGRTGRSVSVIGLGTWQLGAEWGEVSESAAQSVLSEAAAQGVTLFDTADVYGDGRSERAIGRFLAERPGAGITVATKMGRRMPQLKENYSEANFRAWLDRSRGTLGVDTIDLVQLHCPPSDVIAAEATYEVLDRLVDEGVIAAYGVSVETCEQALDAIAHPGVTNVQIIINPFRLKPLDEVLPAAAHAHVAIFARVPLASGLLSGRYSSATQFAENDHRSFNRNGEKFDKGETFSGVPYDLGIEAASRLSAAVPGGFTLPQASLAWIAAQTGVTTVIPGARNAEQVRSNCAAAALLEPQHSEALAEFDAAVREVYDELIRAVIHPQW